MTASGWQRPELSVDDFELFRALILELAGIRMATNKRLLLQNRLGRRLRALGLSSFRQYYDRLRQGDCDDPEYLHFCAAITTHETHFFREPQHFDLLRRLVVPTLVARRSALKTLRVWSAGCSTGQEPYTVAMVLDELLSEEPGWRYRILASDIDAQVLATGQAGRYPGQLAREIPNRFMQRYCQQDDGELAVCQRLRRAVSWHRLNLAEAPPLRPRVDIIFCRNVIMYLDVATRRHLLQTFADSLAADGFLFISRTESLQQLPPLFTGHRSDGVVVYRKAAIPSQERAHAPL